MATYIDVADITDSSLTETALSTRLLAKIALSDAAVVDLAERKGVNSDSISSTIHTLVKQYAIAWVCRETCFDLIGKNPNVTIDYDVYFAKYKIYRDRVSELESQITVEVLTGVVDDVRDRSGARTGIILLAG